MNKPTRDSSFAGFLDGYSAANISSVKVNSAELRTLQQIVSNLKAESKTKNSFLDSSLKALKSKDSYQNSLKEFGKLFSYFLEDEKTISKNTKAWYFTNQVIVEYLKAAKSADDREVLRTAISIADKVKGK